MDDEGGLFFLGVFLGAVFTICIWFSFSGRTENFYEVFPACKDARIQYEVNIKQQEIEDLRRGK